MVFALRQPVWSQRWPALARVLLRLRRAQAAVLFATMGDVAEILGLPTEKPEPRTPLDKVTSRASAKDSGPPSSEKKRKRPSSYSPT